MDEEPPMSLVDDRFDDMSIDDRPVDDAGSFYNEEEFEEEDEAQPTSENFMAGNRYRPSQHTPGQLPTIREEKHDETGSRAASRPPSSNLKNLSDNLNDISGQFQFGSGVNAIEKYTENFYSKQNDAERLFPEHELLQSNFPTSPFDKQNSWEPSVCHYEKQPAPEIITDSPKTIFGNLTRNAPVVNDENEPVVGPSKISPERSIFTTSPLNSTRFLDAKTSTPKRPGASNRLGQRQPPVLELSTIYALSPQRSGTASNTSRLFSSRPTPSIPTTTPGSQASETMMSNRTISESMVRKVISGSNIDTDLFSALEMARKKRERAPIKPDFRVKPSQNRSQLKIPAPLSPPTILENSTTSSRLQKDPLDVTNSNTTNISNMTRMSTAKSMLSSREDVSRMSSSSKFTRGPSSSSSSINTVIPNASTTTITRDGRDSVNSMRTISRASSIMTSSVAPGAKQSSSSTLRPLKIAARRMAFGVVPVSETLTMELEIENISDRRCQVRSKIDSKTDFYRILDNKSTLIEPGKSTKLRVAFTPSSIGRYQVLLVVEVPAQNYYHKIPIWGVGGAASISPVTTPSDLLATANTSEFTMYSANLSRVSFKLANIGARNGFALLTVLDGSMRPLASHSSTCFPSNGIVIRRDHQKRIDVRIDTSALQDDYDDDDPLRRTSSAMSSVSTATARRRAACGADLVIRIAWGDEVLRQRLKMLETQSGRHQDVDGQDFTSSRFTDEDPSRPIPQGFPNVVAEDFSLFASSYRTIYIFVFSSITSFRRASALTSSSSSSSDQTESTILETTAFRNQTFVNDVTTVPRRK